MNKTNLEMFKMSKTQMNNVNGGKKYKCTFLDTESGIEWNQVMESAVSWEELGDKLNDTYSWAFVTCADMP